MPTVMLDKEKKKYYRELINASKRPGIDYRDLAPFMIESQIVSNYAGVRNYAKKYAKAWMDSDRRVRQIRSLLVDIFKASANVKGEDGVIKSFEEFKANVFLPTNEKNLIEKKNSFLRNNTDTGPENVWNEIKNFPQIIYYFFIDAVQGRQDLIKGLRPTLDDYRQVYQDFIRVYAILSKTAYTFITVDKSWGDVERDEEREFEAESEDYELPGGPSAPKLYKGTETDDYESPVATPGEPGEEPGEPRQVAVGSREPKFKGDFEPGAEELIYAMGDFWTRVKETGGGSLIAVQILQAAAEKLGRPNGVKDLFTLAASKLDEPASE